MIADSTPDGCGSVIASTELVHVHDAIDRVSPALEPDLPVLMYQNWHHLLFLHWEIPPSELQALIPAELSVDLFEGKAYIGLVPFTMSGVRPVLAPPVPLISNFHEVNVRTYVHRHGRDPGVWFFSLDASSSVAVAAARAAFRLPYFNARIDFSATQDAIPRIAFQSHRDDPRGAMPAHAHLRYSPSDGAVVPTALGTIEYFLLERYILYTEDDDHQLHRARVHHQPYPVQRAELSQIDETLVWAAGVRRSSDAPLRHYAREVNVKVYPPEKC